MKSRLHAAPPIGLPEVWKSFVEEFGKEEVHLL
jgi:hypothetical protein